MFPNILNVPARGVVCAVLALTSISVLNVARAQETEPPGYGERQSPINIIDIPGNEVRYDQDATKFTDIGRLGMPLTLTVKNTSWGPWCPTCKGSSVDERWGSLKAYPPKDGAPKIKFGEDSYTLVEFHFHSPAEHLVNGRLDEMEVHFVFSRDGTPLCSHNPNGLLVIGRRIKAGRENSTLEKIFGLRNPPEIPLPVNSSSPYVTVNNFIISTLLGGLEYSYPYLGSLTAPSELGCTDPPGTPNQQIVSGYLPEVVQWVLLRDPIEMSPTQIARLQKLFPNGDARGPQTLRRQIVTKTFRGQ